MQNKKIIEKIILAFIPFTEENMLFSRKPQAFYRQLEKEFEVKRNTISAAIYRAKQRGYLVEVESRLEATDAGMMRVSGRLEDINPKHWDKKWRIIIFDIPEKRRATRNFFRNKLKELGFKQHQLSVWITPYDVTNDLEAVIEDLKIEDCVKYIVGESVLGEEELKKAFNLDSE